MQFALVPKGGPLQVALAVAALILVSSPVLAKWELRDSSLNRMVSVEAKTTTQRITARLQ